MGKGSGLRRPADDAVMDALDKTFCRLTDCAGRGYDPAQCGLCMWCADGADGMVEEFLRLQAGGACPDAGGR